MSGKTEGSAVPKLALDNASEKRPRDINPLKMSLLMNSRISSVIMVKMKVLVKKNLVTFELDKIFRLLKIIRGS